MSQIVFYCRFLFSKVFKRGADFHHLLPHTKLIPPKMPNMLSMTSPLPFEKYLPHLNFSVISVSLCSDEGPPCTCPLCASDWSSCVPHSEGLQLSRDLGATYLELPSLNHVFVGRYFGSVVSDHAGPK